jgi:hypothetical protein
MLLEYAKAVPDFHSGPLSNSLLHLDQFMELFNMQPEAATADYTVDVLNEFRAARFQQSVERNPFFFYGPTTGILVEAAPFFFIPRFMSNKSEEFPEGKLNQEILVLMSHSASRH